MAGPGAHNMTNYLSKRVYFFVVFGWLYLSIPFLFLSWIYFSIQTQLVIQWKCAGKLCQTYGELSNRSVTLVNENGSKVYAYINGDTITVKEWGNLKGSISQSPSIIKWSNGTSWER